LIQFSGSTILDLLRIQPDSESGWVLFALSFGWVGGDRSMYTLSARNGPSETIGDVVLPQLQISQQTLRGGLRSVQSALHSKSMIEWRLPKRAAHYEIQWQRPVTTLVQAARFVDHAGFCVLFPVKNVRLPSLYYAVSRRRAARWDKHAELIWKWKDELPKKRRALYGKYFKSRGTFLSVKLLPYFLAMHGSPAHPSAADFFYVTGRISKDACELWQALARHGPLATLELRHLCKLETQAGNKRFKKAMLELQGMLIVTHCGIEQETESWASNRFDLVSRAFPEPSRAACDISPENARRVIAARYRDLYPTAAPVQIARLFSWTKAQAVAALGI